MKDKKPEEIWDIMSSYCPYYMDRECCYNVLKHQDLVLHKCVYKDCQIVKNAEKNKRVP